MGYNTKFDLDVIGRESDPVELNRWYEDLNDDKTFGDYELPLNSDEWDSMKWYCWEADVKVLSKEYPNVLFVLSGEGEDSGDIWRAYFMNGEVQEVQARIVFDEVDFSKFKRIDLTGKRRAELEARRQELLAEQVRLQEELDKLD
jgi:hypothetical protein